MSTALDAIASTLAPAPFSQHSVPQKAIALLGMAIGLRWFGEWEGLQGGTFALIKRTVQRFRVLRVWKSSGKVIYGLLL
jgi:hypothetical protein